METERKCDGSTIFINSSNLEQKGRKKKFTEAIKKLLSLMQCPMSDLIHMHYKIYCLRIPFYWYDRRTFKSQEWLSRGASDFLLQKSDTENPKNFRLIGCLWTCYKLLAINLSTYCNNLYSNDTTKFIFDRKDRLMTGFVCL